jgi:putative nucleotidyltransferase with HDIG domain
MLLIDDDAETLHTIEELLSGSGIAVTAFRGADEARQWLRGHPGEIDVVVTDLVMPGTNGVELLSDLRVEDPTLVGILLTGFANVDNAVDAMRAGAVDLIAKPFDMRSLEMALGRALAQRKVLLDNSRYQEQLAAMVQQQQRALEDSRDHLEQSYQFMLESFVSLLETRERAMGAHTKRVMGISVALARQLGVEDAECEVIRRGAMLHDIGKVGIPDAVLLKRGPLDPAEWKVMQQHVVLGYQMLLTNPYLVEVAELVHSHHEHFDGGGYPRGLSGEDIPLGARIFAVADAYDAIRSKRPYSQPRSAVFTLEEMQRCAGSQFDPHVVEALLACHKEVERIWRGGAQAEDLAYEMQTGASGNGEDPP